MKHRPNKMIGVKRDFFFKFIEKEVAALRYQVAQERNYEQKNSKKTGGSERTFAQKEAFERKGATSKPPYGKEAQGGKPSTRKETSSSVHLPGRLRSPF